MPYIHWIRDRGRPRVIGVFDEIASPAEETLRQTLKQFVSSLGQAEARAALEQFNREQDKFTDGDSQDHAS